MKKIYIILNLILLNGCVQNSALLGPAYTLGSTGNVLQAGLSYGTTYTIKKITGTISFNPIFNYSRSSLPFEKIF